MRIREISSVRNPEVKKFMLLQDKARARRSSGLFIIEGRREIDLAIAGGYSLQSVWFAPEICKSDAENLPCDNFFKISKEVYDKIAYRGTTEGLMAIAHQKKHHLEEFEALPSEPLILVLQSIEKPGNIGAMLRTSDAVGADLVIIADGKTDLYNSNVIRSSVGCLFTVPVAVADSGDAISWLKLKRIKIYSATLQDAEPYYRFAYSAGTAFVLGTESTGVSSQWRKASESNIYIPMKGKIDSLNVSNSAAILAFEALRQREIVD